MPLDTGKAPTSASPLWIIALFIALSEVTAGAASITTSGATRMIFACFAVSFPVVVFVVFIWLLIEHAPKLYAPGQYSQEITPEVYRTGISRVDTTLLSRAVARTVVLSDAENGQGSEDLQIERAARIFEEVFEESSIEIEVSPKGYTDSPLKIPVTSETQVSEFLDQIWFDLRGAVKPFTYGRSWVIINPSDGALYTDIGRTWANERKIFSDVRPITEIGILPGTKLKVVIMSGKESE